MPDPLTLTIHPSQFPAAERAALIAALETGRVDPRLHYVSPLQSARWLEVFRTWAPFVNRPDCRAIYCAAAKRAAGEVNAETAVIALGCGDGSKDMELLRVLAELEKLRAFVPLDVSASLATEAALGARSVLNAGAIFPIVADLARAPDLSQWLDDRLGVGTRRIFTFYGMVPNFEPDVIFPALANLIREGDLLLVSANLNPTEDPDGLTRRILPQYDNEETRAWLMTFLEEGGATRRSGQLTFSVEHGVRSDHPQRIVARFQFGTDIGLRVLDREIQFAAGDDLPLFFSYRYTAKQIMGLLAEHRLPAMKMWITDNGEEAVFLCERNGAE